MFYEYLLDARKKRRKEGRKGGREGGRAFSGASLQGLL
jgi:hypothetical protein